MCSALVRLRVPGVTVTPSGFVPWSPLRLRDNGMLGVTPRKISWCPQTAGVGLDWPGTADPEALGNPHVSLT